MCLIANNIILPHRSCLLLMNCCGVNGYIKNQDNEENRNQVLYLDGNRARRINENFVTEQTC